MVMKQMTGDGHSYRAEVEQIEVSSISPRPDPAWTFTDAAGHAHDATRALLVRKQDDPDEPPFYFDGEGEEHNAPDHLECSLCGEWVVPGTIGPSPFREYVAGATRFYRDDEEITEAEYTSAVEAARANAAARPMEALTSALLGAPPSAGLGVQELCKASAQKAVGEVLDEVFRGAERDPMNGVIRLRYTEFSELVIDRIVRDAIDRCCD